MQSPLSPRPASTQEIAERVPQVITCQEALRECTLFHSVGGKQMSRTFRFDKVRRALVQLRHCMCMNRMSHARGHAATHSATAAAYR